MPNVNAHNIFVATSQRNLCENEIFKDIRRPKKQNEQQKNETKYALDKFIRI